MENTEIQRIVSILSQAFNRVGAKFSKADLVVGLNIKGADCGRWSLIIKDDEISITEGRNDSNEVALIEVTLDNFDMMVRGDLTMEEALETGKMEISGDEDAGQKAWMLFNFPPVGETHNNPPRPSSGVPTGSKARTRKKVKKK